VAVAYTARLAPSGPELPLLLDADARTLDALGGIGEAIQKKLECDVFHTSE